MLDHSCSYEHHIWMLYKTLCTFHPVVHFIRMATRIRFFITHNKAIVRGGFPFYFFVTPNIMLVYDKEQLFEAMYLMQNLEILPKAWRHSLMKQCCYQNTSQTETPNQFECTLFWLILTLLLIILFYRFSKIMSHVLEM